MKMNSLHSRVLACADDNFCRENNFLYYESKNIFGYHFCRRFADNFHLQELTMIKLEISCSGNI